MTLKYYGGVLITGLSSDTKPTTDMPSPYLFLETDSRTLWLWNGSNWVQVVLTTTISGLIAAFYTTVLNKTVTNDSAMLFATTVLSKTADTNTSVAFI